MEKQTHLPYGARSSSLHETTDEERLNLIALASNTGIGFATLSALYRNFPDLREVWDSDPEHLVRILSNSGFSFPRSKAERLHKDRDSSLDQAKRELERFGQRSIFLITDRDTRYPEGLRDLKNPPPWLFLQGSIELLNSPGVAVVGTRHPSPEGEAAARCCAGELTELGVSVISGLAEGIDAVVHQTVLDLNGKAIAVLGHGINIVFPASTAALRDSIVKDGGLLVTEYLPYDNYDRNKFVQRNRIQAALAKIVIPIQGAMKSGTAHTIEFASQLGRQILGVTQGIVEQIPQNELLNLLRERNCRIYDLTSERESFQKTIQVTLELKNVPIRDSKLGGILKVFERWFEKYHLTENEFNLLVVKLSEVWKKHLNDNVTKNRRN